MGVKRRRENATMTRTLMTACAILATSWMALGCGSNDKGTGSSTEPEAETGTMGLPLSAVAPSGVEYRLRNATFDIWGWPDRCYDEDCEDYEQSISSEDYLDEPSIMLDLLKGYYDIYLNDGWQLEKVVDGEGEVVEAQLLNDAYQYAYVQPYQTRWVTYEFGVGDEKLWFTGQVEINMGVYEDPEDYYGGDCYIWGDGEECWQECCKEYCDPYDGCWGECWEEPVPCEGGGGGGGSAGAGPM
jgi:hypothetical protein